MENKAYYEKQYNDFNEIKVKLDKRFSMISTFRIISFLLGAAFLFIGIFDGVSLLKPVGVVLLLTFIFLVKLHRDVVYEQEKIKSKCRVAERYIKRFEDEWRDFSDTGEEFLTDEDTVQRDIDLLGRASLYQLINVCHTEKGRKLFADELRLKGFDLKKLEIRKEAVSELVSKKEFAINYEASGIRLSERKTKQSTNDFVNYCNDEKTDIVPFWMEALRFLLPFTEITLIVLSFLGFISYGYPLAGFIVLLAVSGFTSERTGNIVTPLYSIGAMIEDYEDMLYLIEEEEFCSEYLLELKSHIAGEEGSINAFKGLKKISQAYNLSYNPFLHIIFTGILLWDYHLAHFTSKWKKKYGKNLGKTFDIIAEFEELLSLSVLGNIRQTTWGFVYEDKDSAYLTGNSMYHPLINPETVVDNSITLSGGITIITGSNMSGKTTFLRTVAVNLVLAYIGAPVCAKNFKACYMKLFTSMRVTDDVAHGISTFYAEILRIKAMAEFKEKDIPMLCMIDEIFKGTNSADRIVGAKEAITRLAGKKCITVVSTHDFELCNIKDKSGNKADNYHFEEYYEDDELKFDYKIRNGRCTTTNALAILRMAGFDVSN